QALVRPYPLYNHLCNLRPSMKKDNEPHLWDRGSGKQQNWYLRLPIPKPLRQHFGNKLSIVRPLDTGDLAMARRKRDELVVRYRRIFDRLSAGEEMTPDQIKQNVDMELVATQFEWLPRDVIDIINRRLGVSARGNSVPLSGTFVPTAPTTSTTNTETIGQAAEAWFADMQRDPSAAVRQQTMDGHRLRVRAFVEHCGDIPLASITRVMASDFLTKIGATRLSNRTINNYATTLAGVFKNARYRGRFIGENPFEGQKRKAGGHSYDPFTMGELQSLFGSF